MGHGRSVLREDLHVMFRRADAVGRQRIRPEDSDMLHKLDGRHIILFPQLGHLVVHLRHMERKYGSRLHVLLICPF